ncbi:hypothetical protein D623_10005477 [Myotis brandtii]|uniref:Uncharacterized protein n=1 Tax=Myotis brandtii TaxID=109478 RepID=S7ML90_MYOBR|nr:hypothetical protein D623_10005477 [Myotis brandtii]
MSECHWGCFRGIEGGTLTVQAPLILGFPSGQFRERTPPPPLGCFLLLYVPLHLVISPSASGISMREVFLEDLPTLFWVNRRRCRKPLLFPEL